jgi:hypothetical protein
MLKAALLATALGLMLELLVPGSRRIIAIGALVFGVATWIVPPLLMALFGNRNRSSLQRVGFTITLLWWPRASPLSVFRWRCSPSFSRKRQTGPGSVCWRLRHSGYWASSRSLSPNGSIGGPGKFPSRSSSGRCADPGDVTDFKISNSLKPLLRANGSRECAPDDRLQRSNPSSRKERMDCFVARAPRNDGRRPGFAISQRVAPEVCYQHSALSSEGAGKPGARCAR